MASRGKSKASRARSTAEVQQGSGVSRESRIIPEAPLVSHGDAAHARMWGFADSAFEVSGQTIVLQSSRYASGGRALDSFAPFVKKAVGVAFDPLDRHELVPPLIPDALAAPELIANLMKELGAGAVSVDADERLRHGHGHHLEEIYQLLFEKLERVPDVVVMPENDEQIAAVLRIAQEHRALVIPFGGGTCVSMALHCVDKNRVIVSLDMRRMNRIEWICPISKTASIQGGAVGRVLEEQLRDHGFTLGHEPDSIEFSTIGGWVATAASGMKKNRYGNIEDIVLDVTVVTASGESVQTRAFPRTSHGLNIVKLVVGSEGLLGVISRVVVRLHRAPQVQRYGSLVFPCWQDGLAFMEELSTWQATPASVRLVDNMQFQFGRALKPAGSSALMQSVQKFVVTQVKGIDLEQMVACTLVYEGQDEEQRNLEQRVMRLAKQFGGFGAGGAAGKDGYNLTFGIAYIRDFLLQYWTLGDSFETSVPWGKVDDVIGAVKSAIVRTHAESGLAGHPFITARVSQIYPTGACLYFYIGFHYKGVKEPLAVFRHIEHEARLAILNAGGALSHHHGVGKIRAPYLDRVQSSEARTWAEQVRNALDPEGLFRSGNQGI